MKNIDGEKLINLTETDLISWDADVGEYTTLLEKLDEKLWTQQTANTKETNNKNCKRIKSKDYEAVTRPNSCYCWF